jgi:hypothetical protein
VGFREGPGSPQNPDGWPWEPPVAPGAPSARAKQIKSPYILQGPFKRPSSLIVVRYCLAQEVASDVSHEFELTGEAYSWSSAKLPGAVEVAS